MKVIYNNKKFDWKYGSIDLAKILKDNSPNEKVFLNGNGSGECHVEYLRDVHFPERHHKTKTPRD